MKKATKLTSELAVGQILTREEMKKVSGGKQPTTTCSCTLKSSTGVTFSPTISSADSGSASDCQGACSTYCSGANSVGGDCASYSYVWTSSSPS